MASMVPPKKNAAFTLFFTLYANDGTIVANPGTITKKVSIDGGAVADISASVTEEDTTYGQCSLVLSAAEMNGDAIWIYITDDTAGTVPLTLTLYTARNTNDESTGIISTGTAQSGSATGIVLAAATSLADDLILGATIIITAGTGVGQARTITDWDSASDTATVDTWVTNPANDSVYVILATPPSSTTAPITATIATGGITNASFAAGAIDAAAIAADAITSSEFSASAATRVAAAVWASADRQLTALDEDATTIDLNATAVGSVTGAVGSVTGNVGGNVTGSVGSVAAGGITAASFGANAIDAAALSDDAVDAILDEVVEGSVTFRQMLRGFASALLSKVSGAGTTTVTFRDIGDSKNRIVGTVDSDGNRSVVTLTLT